MKQVAELAEQIPEVQKFRAGRRNKLKRTFVGAGDAVQAKLLKTDAPRKLEAEPEDWTPMETEELTDKFKLKFDETQKSKNLRELLKDIVFFEVSENDHNASLNKTLACMQKAGKVEMKFDAQQQKFFYIFNGQIVGEGAGEAKKPAKKLADADLLQTLKGNCWTIRSKLEYYSAEDVIKPNEHNATNESANNEQLQENNLGFKMLKMLGWKGGSLGPKGNGILDPVKSEIKIGRGGLGANSSEQFDKKYFRNLLTNFKNSQVEYDLVFSKEFTKEERAQIHQ